MTTDAKLVERSFDAGQVVINYAESPGSGTPLLLLHGGTLNWHSFNQLIPTLSRSWPIYACDFRGHGRSGWSRSGYRIGDFASDTATFIANRIGEPVILIGFSLGASVSIQLAATVPHLVAAAVLIEPPLALREVAWTETANTEGDDAGPAPYDYVSWVYESIKSNPTIEQIVRRVLERNQEAGLDPPDIEAARAEAAELKTLDPMMVDDLLHDRESEGFDIEKMIQQLRCPTLLLCGEPELGGLVRDSDAMFFKSTVTDGTAIRITGGGHGIIWDQPGQAILGHVSRFLASLPERSPSAF